MIDGLPASPYNRQLYYVLFSGKANDVALCQSLFDHMDCFLLSNKPSGSIPGGLASTIEFAPASLAGGLNLENQRALIFLNRGRRAEMICPALL